MRRRFHTPAVVTRKMPDRPTLASLPVDAVDIVIAVVGSIPTDYVASYAQVAYHAGLTRRRARFVSKVLRDLPAENITPWHRVIASTGIVPNRPSAQQQIKRLKEEGIVFEGDNIPRSFFWWSLSWDQAGL